VTCLSPTWWVEQSESKRVPYPLPDGLGFSDVPDTFKHTNTGIELVWHPPGTFVFGLNPRENVRIGGEDQLPPHSTTISRGFYLARFELTRAEYRAFCVASAITVPEPEAVSQDIDEGKLPMVLSWDQAQAYCAWGGFRLPTEAEWEYASEGGDAARVWPWGDEEPGRNHCNLAGEKDGFAGPSPVGSFPLGVSRWGCMDMAGNLWEWVEDVYRRYPPSRDPLVDYVNHEADEDGRRKLAVRGAGWREQDITRATCNYRASAWPQNGADHSGAGDVAAVRVVFTGR
jgi:formylglycine-generating enzyme required for sulfatase activity